MTRALMIFALLFFWQLNVLAAPSAMLCATLASKSDSGDHSAHTDMSSDNSENNLHAHHQMASDNLSTTQQSSPESGHNDLAESGLVKAGDCQCGCDCQSDCATVQLPTASSGAEQTIVMTGLKLIYQPMHPRTHAPYSHTPLRPPARLA